MSSASVTIGVVAVVVGLVVVVTVAEVDVVVATRAGGRVSHFVFSAIT